MILFKNKPYKLELGVIDNKGDFKSGLVVDYTVYKSSDNSSIQSGTMIEIGTSGIYQALITFTISGQYRAEYKTPRPYENAIESFYIETFNESIKRILGLSQENFRVVNPSYNKKGELTNGKVKIYNNASDCDNDINPLAEYQVIATYDAKNKVTGYKSKKL